MIVYPLTVIHLKLLHNVRLCNNSPAVTSSTDRLTHEWELRV